MVEHCPLCGAPSVNGTTCRERFDLALAKEIEDPAYGAVHHLTVPAYMLQHNGYSHDGWLYSRTLLDEFLNGGLSPADARRREQSALDSGNRTWSVTRGPKFARFDQILWTRTIADVRFDGADHYCADVRAWAAAVLADSEPVVS